MFWYAYFGPNLELYCPLPTLPHFHTSGKESARNAGDLSLIPGLEDPLEKEPATLWENPWIACWATVHGVTEESDMTEHACIKMTITTQNLLKT